MKRWKVRLLGYGMMSVVLPAVLFVALRAGQNVARAPENLPARQPRLSPAPVLQPTHAILGAGGTLDAAFEQLGLRVGMRGALVRAVAEHVDLRRLSPNTGIHMITDRAGNPRQLSIRHRADGFVRVVWDDPAAAPRATPIELPSVPRIESTGGRIESSLIQSLAHLEYGSELALAFADIFQWDIDLLVDPRQGDLVRVVYEIEELGEVPEDLPAFGTAASRSGDRLRVGRILAASYEGRVAGSDAFWVDTDAQAGGYFDGAGQPLQKTFLRSPLTYRRISSRFSRARRNPVTRKVVPHHGVDFAAPAGTPVVAAADGQVLSTDWRGALGRAVRIRHGSEYETIYGHLSGVAKGIRPGTKVRQNQVIGFVGSTGRATGPHLHYTLKERGRPVDPLRFKNPPANALPSNLWPRLERAKTTWSDQLESIRFFAGDTEAVEAPQLSSGV